MEIASLHSTKSKVHHHLNPFHLFDLQSNVTNEFCYYDAVLYNV